MPAPKGSGSSMPRLRASSPRSGRNDDHRCGGGVGVVSESTGASALQAGAATMPQTSTSAHVIPVARHTLRRGMARDLAHAHAECQRRDWSCSHHRRATSIPTGPRRPRTGELSMTADPAHDFDFHFGSWNAHHRRLKERLENCTEWVEFDGTATAGPLLGGRGNMDDNVFHTPSGDYRGVTLRAFDPETKKWAIWWLDGRFPHTLDAPMIGRFENGVGTF